MSPHINIYLFLLLFLMQSSSGFLFAISLFLSLVTDFARLSLSFPATFFPQSSSAKPTVFRLPFPCVLLLLVLLGVLVLARAFFVTAFVCREAASDILVTNFFPRTTDFLGPPFLFLFFSHEISIVLFHLLLFLGRPLFDGPLIPGITCIP